MTKSAKPVFSSHLTKLRTFGALAAATMVAVAAIAPPAASQTSLSVDTARDLVPMLVHAGQPSAARAMALALLAEDPTNVALLLALSRAERDLGNGEASVTAGRAAFVAARSGDERFAASMIMAQALASDGRHIAAGVWLRRAADEAPTEAQRARAIRDLSYVRSRSALGVSLDAAVVPSNNVNNGPTTNQVTLGGLTFIAPDAVPIAGIEAQLGADVTYRLRETETARSTLTFGLDILRVRLGPEAATINPDLTNDDLSRESLRIGIVQEWQPQGATGSYRLGAEVSQDFAGHSPVARSLSGDLKYRFPIGQTDAGWIGLGLRHTDRLDQPIRSYDQRTLSGGLTFALAEGRKLDLGVRIADTDSESRAVANVEGGLQARLDLGLGAGDIGWALTANAAKTAFDSALYSPDPRRDVSIDLGVSAVLHGGAYMGFAPELTFDWSRVHSNVPSFDTRSLQVGFGVVSSF